MLVVKTRRIKIRSLSKIASATLTQCLCIPSDASEKDYVLLGGFVANSVREGGLGGLVVGFENSGREARLGVRMHVWRAEGFCRVSKPNNRPVSWA